MKPQLNKWEELFVDFLDMTEFCLRRCMDDDETLCYCLEDGQKANLADIESEYFYSAMQILDRMEVYEYDYIIADLIDCMRNAYIEPIYDEWTDLLKYRYLMPNNQANFYYIDMICNHPHDIDIDKVYNYLQAA